MAYINQSGGVQIGRTIRINPNLIPSVEKNMLCATFLEAVLRFYEDPANARAFEKWRSEKGGSVNGPEHS
jgi:hypothetical protein